MLPALRNNLSLAVQAAICLTSVAVIAFAPPAKGAILIVSLSGQSASEMAQWAMDGRARLVGAGPLPHSLVVSGERAELGMLALRQRAVLLASVSAGCGGKRV